MNGAIDGWRNAGPGTYELPQLQRRYVEAWRLYTGELFESALKSDLARADPAIYKDTKLLWKHAEAVVDFYSGVIYQGSLPATGNELMTSTQSAIPIKSQLDDAEQQQNEQLFDAIAELFAAWNWQQQMSLRPMYGAALGDVLTELIDDPDRRFVYPQSVWPGYVTEIELDYVGNVRSYTLEYRVSERRSDGSFDRYLYRKEVTGEEFRYFRDDKPYDYGDGAVVPNPYGFVPAIWDRHRLGAPGEIRGRSALHGTRQAILQLNSIFSHAFDYQRKAFFAPLMITGKKAPGEKAVDVTSAPETFEVVGVPADAQLLQAEFDIGKTREMLQDLQQGIMDENPEARFYQQMREMQQVTAPGAERLMGDVKNRVDLARAGYDSQTVKLLQMAIAICGMRANGDWRSGGLDRRRETFVPFGLESFAQGRLAFVIGSRPLVKPTEAETVDVILQKEALQSRWGMELTGMDTATVGEILAERRDRFMTGMATGSFGV